MVSVLGGFWPDVDFGFQLAPGCTLVPGSGLILGAVLCNTLLSKYDAPPMDRAHSIMRQGAISLVRSTAIQGFVDYEVAEVIRLHEPIDCPTEFGPESDIIGDIQGRGWFESASGAGSIADRGFQDVAASWIGRGAHALVVPKFFAAPVASDALGKGGMFWRCLHTVVVTAKLNRKRMLITDAPTAEMKAKFFKDVAGISMSTRPTHVSSASHAREASYDPLMLIERVDATRFLKNFRSQDVAADKFATIFARALGTSAQALKESIQRVAPELIRRARVRVDVVAMLLRRQYFEKLRTSTNTLGQQPHIYLFCDASPQWGQGLELFSISIELVVGGVFERHLMPLLILPGTMLDAEGKTICPLWGIFLIVGPSFLAMRWFLNCVEGITSDQGAERKINDMRDILCLFYR